MLVYVLSYVVSCDVTATRGGKTAVGRGGGEEGAAKAREGPTGRGEGRRGEAGQAAARKGGA